MSKDSATRNREACPLDPLYVGNLATTFVAPNFTHLVPFKPSAGEERNLQVVTSRKNGSWGRVGLFLRTRTT
jgi:hypothetical protein